MNNITLAIILSTISTSALAENFTGLSISGEAAFKSMDGKYSFQEVSYDADKEVVVGALDINYAFDLKNDFILSVGAAIDLSSTNINVFEAYGVNSNTGDIYKITHQFKEKNHYSVYLAPAFLITPNFLVYGKLAYHHMKSEFDINPQASQESNSPPRYQDYSGRNNVSSTNNHHGFGYGLGAKYSFLKNWFSYAEIQRIDYSKEKYSDNSREYDPQTTRGALGIGYNF